MKTLLAILTLALLALGGCQSPSPPPTSDGAAAATASTSVLPRLRTIDALRKSTPSPFARPTRRHPTKAPPARVDARTPVEIAQAACAGRCKGAAVKPLAAANVNGPIIPASWTVPAWYRDIANSTGCASDSNSGTAATCSGGCAGSVCPSGIGPVVHYQEIAVHRWGTYSPRLQQATLLTGLSSDTDDSDPIYAVPYNESGSLTIVGALPPPVCTTTFSAVTAKARTHLASQLLNVTFAACAGAAANQLVVNTTPAHPSRAWIYTAGAGSSWNMSQPQTPVVPPFNVFGSGPAEVNTWAIGDTVSVYNLLKLNVVQFGGIQDTYDINEDNIEFGYQFTLFDPNGFAAPNVGADDAHIGPYVNLIDVQTQRFLLISSVSEDLSVIFINGNVQGDMESALYPSAFGEYGGIQFGDFTQFLSNDVIVATNATLRNSTIELVYIETGATLHVTGENPVIAASGPVGPFVWGPGTLDVVLTGAVSYPPTEAVATFLQTGLTINSQSTACSYTVATPSVINCGISITPAHLDAAAGAAGFGGIAFLPGGGSLTTYGL